jgi:hypothetical protein
VSDGHFPQFVQVDGLLQGGEQVCLPVAPGPAHVDAQLSDLLMVMTEDVNDVGRDDYLESFHSAPLA